MKAARSLPLVAVAFAVALAALGASFAGADNVDVCRFFPNGTLVRDPDSCSRYLECIDFVGVYHECPAATPFFDKSTVKCVKSLSDDSSCYINCADDVGRFVEDPKSCYGYYYCADGESPVWGQCPLGTHFNYTESSCVHKESSACALHTLDFCQLVKDGVNFNDETSCSSYHTCAKGVLTTKTCSSTTYYDPVSGSCVAKSLVECAAHPYPSNVCGTAAKPTAKDKVADQASCRGYFYCGAAYKTEPLWFQCPENTFFDETSQDCLPPTDVKCSWDRCDGRTKDFVVAGTVGCRYYLRCVDGVTYEEGSCGNYFFDEAKGACVSSQVTYTACAK